MSFYRTMTACAAMAITLCANGTALLPAAAQGTSELQDSSTQSAAPAKSAPTGNVIFFHPDGTGVNHWTAARIAHKGPDGTLNWDKLPALGVYTGHMKTRLTGTSHGGATVHAYGVKVHHDSFGLDREGPITAASGKQLSIAREAMAAGKAVGLIQTGHIAEPGTAVFVASAKKRSDRDGIAAQVLESGAQVIMAGGERYLLPEGTEGFHGKGTRTDGLNLIAKARQLGYTIVYNATQLAAVDLAATDKLLGVFAHNHTFNDRPRERNLLAGDPTYVDGAPSIAQMLAAALPILSRNEKGFLAVVEEEGTDNLANAMNAFGTLEALKRADEAVGVAHGFAQANPDTLLIMAADSDAAGLQVYSGRFAQAGEVVRPVPPAGGLLYGQQGAFGDVFMSAPDANGVRHPFAIALVGYSDVAGGILVRGAGLNSDRITPLIDATDVYKVMHTTLFGTVFE